MLKNFVLVFFIAICSIFACTPNVILTDSNKDKADVMIRTMNGHYSIAQFDSLCLADTLPPIDKWEMLGTRDHETKKVIKLYFFIKENNRYETVYKVEFLNDDSVKIIKREITDF